VKTEERKKIQKRKKPACPKRRAVNVAHRKRVRRAAEGRQSSAATGDQETPIMTDEKSRSGRTSVYLEHVITRRGDRRRRRRRGAKRQGFSRKESPYKEKGASQTLEKEVED